MITITFIRHGESTDNLRSVWAGWADAPLSNHGVRQAQALGEFFSNTRLTAIYASPLKRAHSTALAVFDAQQSPKPPLHVDPDLREQHFGVAEGKPWIMHYDNTLTIEEHIARNKYPTLPGRNSKFPDAESLDDVKDRVERAVEEIVTPYIREIVREGREGAHIAIVSHGIAIAEMVGAIMRLDASERLNDGEMWRGLYNTAWTRLSIELKDTPLVNGNSDNVDAHSTELPPLKVRVTHVNQKSHLENIKRQPGGLGRIAHDPKQKDIRAFFGGGAVENEEEGRSDSNAKDDIVVAVVDQSAERSSL